MEQPATIVLSSLIKRFGDFLASAPIHLLGIIVAITLGSALFLTLSLIAVRMHPRVGF